MSEIEAEIGLGSFLCLGCHDGAQASDRTNIAGSITAEFDPEPLAEHPVSIPYGGRRLTSEIESGDRSRSDFAPLSFAEVNSEPSWWIDTGGIDNIRNKTDVLLYGRHESTNDGLPVPYVECASCHDPHTNEKGNFLRLSNESSAVCRSCHTK